MRLREVGGTALAAMAIVLGTATGADAAAAFPATGPAPVTGSPTAVEAVRDRVIEVDVVGISGAAGTSPADAVNAAATIAALDAAYDAATGGTYRFRIGRFATVSAPGPLCTLEQADTVARAALGEPDTVTGSGAVVPARLRVSVTAEQACAGYRGMADIGGPALHLNGPWGEAGLPWLAHEVGHSLGLGHSSALVSPDLRDRWAAAPTGERGIGAGDVVDYGDPGDVMGWLLLGPQVHLSGPNLARLGVLSPDQVVTVAGSGTYALQPLARSLAGGGAALLTIPWDDRHVATVEYRAATGIDADLAGQDRAWPGAGVYVHLIAAQPGSWIESPRGVEDPELRGTQAVVAADRSRPGDPTGTRFGFRAGESLALPDGSVLRVDEAGPAGATVTVSRPADAAPIARGRALRVTGARRPGSRSTAAAPGVTVIAPGGTVRADLSTLRDDRWLARAELLVDGRVAASATFSAPLAYPTANPGALRWTARPGRHVVALRVTDAGGASAVVARRPVTTAHARHA